MIFDRKKELYQVEFIVKLEENFVRIPILMAENDNLI